MLSPPSIPRLSKALNPQLLPGRRSINDCPLLRVCVHSVCVHCCVCVHGVCVCVCVCVCSRCVCVCVCVFTVCVFTAVCVCVFTAVCVFTVCVCVCVCVFTVCVCVCVCVCEELVYCANPLTHSPGQNMSDHRTSYQLPSHYVVEESHKDTDNATQPKQALLMDILAELCPQSSSHADCDVQQLQSSKTQHSRTTFWKTAWEARTTHHSHRKHQS